MTKGDAGGIRSFPVLRDVLPGANTDSRGDLLSTSYSVQFSFWNFCADFWTQRNWFEASPIELRRWLPLPEEFTGGNNHAGPATMHKPHCGNPLDFKPEESKLLLALQHLPKGEQLWQF
jgi:hypothetical protein